MSATEEALADALSDVASHMGQITIRTVDDRFVLTHRDDVDADQLETSQDPSTAIQIAMFDDSGNFRPLKTAPNLKHGWRLELADLDRVADALNYFYPGRLSILASWNAGNLGTTNLRETLNRQSGMYRVAAKISDEAIDNVVGNFCRSDGGCLRTILWKRDADGNAASAKLQLEKYDPTHDQTDRHERVVPLLCQEACNLLVNECRKTVKGE